MAAARALGHNGFDLVSIVLGVWVWRSGHIGAIAFLGNLRVGRLHEGCVIIVVFIE